MTFDELKNGMNSLFSSLGAKTSDSNYAVGLYDKTSAEPKGIMAMSSLASVLGGTLRIIDNLNASNDLDSLHEDKTVSKVYICTGAYPANWPGNVAGNGIVIDFSRSTGAGFQIVFGTRGIAIRNKGISVTGWSSWVSNTFT